MIEPQNDDERKALRLLKARWPGIDDEDANDEDMAGFLRVLCEARAIFREEQVEKAANPRSPAKDAELRAVREEIRLRSEVLRAFPDIIDPRDGAYAERERQGERFGWLLRRERELMGEEWTT